MVVSMSNRPNKNEISATVSYLFARGVVLRMAKNENSTLVIKRRVASAVKSSIRVTLPIFKARTDVMITRQKPTRLDDALSICGDLLSFSAIYCYNTNYDRLFQKHNVCNYDIYSSRIPWQQYFIFFCIVIVISFSVIILHPCPTKTL